MYWLYGGLQIMIKINWENPLFTDGTPECHILNHIVFHCLTCLTGLDVQSTALLQFINGQIGSLRC